MKKKKFFGRKDDIVKNKYILKSKLAILKKPLQDMKHNFGILEYGRGIQKSTKILQILVRI